jgi:hypothetical protein
MALRRVDLPEPLGPMTIVIAFFLIVVETFLSAWSVLLGYWTVTSISSRAFIEYILLD